MTHVTEFKFDADALRSDLGRARNACIDAGFIEPGRVRFEKPQVGRDGRSVTYRFTVFPKKRKIRRRP